MHGEFVERSRVCEKSGCREEKGVDKLFKPLSKSGQKPVRFARKHRRIKSRNRRGVFQRKRSSLQSVFGSDRKYWSAEMKHALGLGDSGGFPYQLSPLASKVSLRIPAVPFDGKALSLKKTFNAEIKIYVTRKFREIFQKTKIRHTSGTEAKH